MAVTCSSREDLDRQVVKSESCKVLVPDLELEIPAATQRGVVTTVEGVLTRAADELAALQPQRLVADADVGRKVQRVIDSLRDRAAGDGFPFQLIVDDPAGNSFVQPLHQPDGALTTTHYERTDADAIALGFRPGEHAPVADGTTETASKTLEGVDNMLATPSEEREVMTFGVDCPHCRAPGEEQMCVAASFWRGASTVWGVAPPPDPRARHAADVLTPSPRAGASRKSRTSRSASSCPFPARRAGTETPR